MDCPHCKRPVSVFSREMNGFGDKNCPNCGKRVRMHFNLGALVLWFLPLAIGSLVLRPWLGSFSLGIAGFCAALLAMRLKPA